MARLPLVCLLLTFSGAAGLIYQVAWVRLLGLSFGVTLFAISTVIAAFMAGLAIGSIVGGRLADRSRDSLRVYGVVEIGIGLAALASPAALTALQEVYRILAALADPTQAPLLSATVRTLLAFLVLIVPTTLMGATLPLAVRGVRRAVDLGGDSRAMSWLYALNTAGAIVGTLAAGFVLIAQIGIGATIAVAAAGNFAAGLGGLMLARADRQHTPPVDRGLEPHLAPATPKASAFARAAFWAFGISGAVALAYEVVWSRILAILFDSTVYGFVLMLATVLLGIALGSAVAGPLISRAQAGRAVGQALGWLEIGIGLGAILSLAAFGVIYRLVLDVRDRGPAVFADLLTSDARLMAMLCVLTVLPASLLMGATFPAAARLWAAGTDRLGSRLGGVYAANVGGAIVGSLAAGFVLVPTLGAHTSLLLLVAINIVLGAVLLWLSSEHRGAVAALGAAAGLACLGWGATRPTIHAQVFAQRHPEMDLLWYEEGLETTVSVARDIYSGTQVLYTNSLGQSSDAPDVVNHHRRIGHLGALLAPRLQRILVVGLGVGTTAGAVAQHTGAQVEVVELSDSVVPGARLFSHTNADLLSRGNVFLAIDDGRNHLLRAREPYDLIVADVINPYNAGANNLYSVEFFRLAARALAPDGLMVQWVPLDDAFAHRLIMRTFLEAFPDSTLWLSTDVLVGARRPQAIDRERMNERLRDPSAELALGEVGFVWREHVMAQFRADASGVRQYVGEGPILSDDRPLLEYFVNAPEH